MKIGHLFKLVLFALILVVTQSCDDHEHIDKNIHVGYVLCSDGQTVAIDDCEKDGKEPVAVVFYTSENASETGEGLAVGLREIYPVAFSDTLGVNQGTSADTEKKDGNGNTFTLYSNNKAKSPLAEEVFAYWRYGQSAYIPSVAEMRILHTSLPIVNPLLKRCGGDTISVMPGHCWYWTSTEVSGQASAKAWLYSLGTGAMQETPKIETHPARAIITLFK